MSRKYLIVIVVAVALGFGTIMAVCVLVGMLLPAIAAVRQTAQRMASMSNLHQIGISFHNDLTKNGTFPAQANFDKQGRPLLSWRVHMLPYLGEDALYKRFHLDEPWDSRHNKRLIPLMPKVYANPSGKAEPGMANYLAVCGEGLMFDGEKGRSLDDIRDGLSKTIMVVEANDDHAVIWTKPDDWQFDPADSLAGLGCAHPGGFCALFADGSVHFITRSIDPKVFHALLTIAGHENVMLPE